MERLVKAKGWGYPALHLRRKEAIGGDALLRKFEKAETMMAAQLLFCPSLRLAPLQRAVHTAFFPYRWMRLSLIP